MSDSINSLRKKIRELESEIDRKNEELEIAHATVFYWIERTGQAENELKLLKWRQETHA